MTGQPRKQSGRVTAKKPRVGEESNHLPRLTVDILVTPQLPEEVLDIPNLGGSVLLRAFNGRVAKEAREWATPKDERGEVVPGAEMDEDLYERALVLYGVVEPKLTEEDVEKIFSEQFSFVGRMIALSILSLNAAGRAVDISKVSGKTRSGVSDFK